MRNTDGRATSASTSITVWSSSAAMLIARLMDVKLLPSPGSALVTMIRLPCFTVAAPRPMALEISGRLMTRYWSAMWLRGALGVTMPLEATSLRLSSTERDLNSGSAAGPGSMGAEDWRANSAVLANG